MRVETIQAPRTFATPHIFSEKNQFPATFTVDEDVVLLKGSKESVFTLMHSMPLFLHNFLCVSTSCNKCTMTRLKVLSFRGIRNRFIYYLFEHQQKDSNVVELEHTQEQLAEYFGCLLYTSYGRNAPRLGIHDARGTASDTGDRRERGGNHE